MTLMVAYIRAVAILKCENRYVHTVHILGKKTWPLTFDVTYFCYCLNMCVELKDKVARYEA